MIEKFRIIRKNFVFNCEWLCKFHMEYFLCSYVDDYYCIPSKNVHGQKIELETL